MICKNVARIERMKGNGIFPEAKERERGGVTGMSVLIHRDRTRQNVKEDSLSLCVCLPFYIAL